MNYRSSLIIIILLASFLINVKSSLQCMERTSSKKRTHETEETSVKRPRLNNPEENQLTNFTVISNDQKVITVPSTIAQFIKINEQPLHEENNNVDLPASTINAIFLFLENIKYAYAMYLQSPTQQNLYNLLYAALKDTSPHEQQEKVALFTQLTQTKGLFIALRKLGLQPIEKLFILQKRGWPNRLDLLVYDQRFNPARAKVTDYVQHDDRLITTLKNYLIAQNSTQSDNINPTIHNPTHSFDARFKATQVEADNNNTKPKLQLIITKNDFMIAIMNRITEFKWSPHANFITFINTTHELSSVNMDTNDTIYSYQLPINQSAFHISWSPDGNYITAVNANSCFIFDKTLNPLKILKATERMHITTNKARSKLFSNLIWSPDSHYFSVNYHSEDNPILGYEIFINQNSQFQPMIYDKSISAFMGFLPGNYYLKGEEVSNIFQVTALPLHNPNSIPQFIIYPSDFHINLHGNMLLYKTVINGSLQIRKINMSHVVQLLNYFSHPLQLEELLLLREIELARSKRKKYTLDANSQEVFNNLGKNLGGQFSQMLRHLLLPLITPSIDTLMNQ